MEQKLTVLQYIDKHLLCTQSDIKEVLCNLASFKDPPTNYLLKNILMTKIGKMLNERNFSFAGSLIKIVYFSTNSKCSTNDEAPTLSKERQEVPNGDLNHHILSGRLYFIKFETSKIEDCIKFLSSKKLQKCGRYSLWCLHLRCNCFSYADLIGYELAAR